MLRSETRALSFTPDAISATSACAINGVRGSVRRSDELLESDAFAASSTYKPISKSAFRVAGGSGLEITIPKQVPRSQWAKSTGVQTKSGRGATCTSGQVTDIAERNRG